MDMIEAENILEKAGCSIVECKDDEDKPYFCITLLEEIKSLETHGVVALRVLNEQNIKRAISQLTIAFEEAKQAAIMRGRNT